MNRRNIGIFLDYFIAQIIYLIVANFRAVFFTLSKGNFYGGN